MSPRYQDAYDFPLLTPHRSRARARDLESTLLSPLDAGLDRVGDYVARRLVPAMLSRSERPLQLVVNFGTLHLGADEGCRVGSSAGNAVVYNAPGGVMSMGCGSGSGGITGVTGGVGGRRPSLLGGIDGEGTYGYGYGYGVGEKRRVGICDGCFKRQLVGVSGWCVECELGAVGLGAGARERVGLDGVRYGYGRMPEGRSEWLRREERDERERERLREMDERLKDFERARKMRRERERRSTGLGGYYGGFERDELRYATDRDGFGYSEERW